jgi:hypothetical protein
VNVPPFGDGRLFFEKILEKEANRKSIPSRRTFFEAIFFVFFGALTMLPHVKIQENPEQPS